jgi:hypothetical protein
LATFSNVRTRSALLTACFPRVDIALRRAKAAALAVLLDELPAAVSARDAAARGAGGGALAGELAGALRVACFCDCGIPAFPPADIARRRASATSLLLLVLALCAMFIPATCSVTSTPGSRPVKLHADQPRPSKTTKHTPWLWV